MASPDDHPSEEPEPFSVTIDKSEPVSVPIEEVQPSQLYLNGRKLSLVTEWFDFADPNYDALPVRRITSPNAEDGDSRWTLTDGHTRAFVALLAGTDELRVVYDADDLDVETYRRCVEWCRNEGVTEIADLGGRVLNADDFEKKWVARCQSFADGE